jgi:hypothetical protein
MEDRLINFHPPFRRSAARDLFGCAAVVVLVAGLPIWGAVNESDWRVQMYRGNMHITPTHVFGIDGRPLNLWASRDAATVSLVRFSSICSPEPVYGAPQSTEFQASLREMVGGSPVRLLSITLSTDQCAEGLNPGSRRQIEPAVPLWTVLSVTDRAVSKLIADSLQIGETARDLGYDEIYVIDRAGRVRGLYEWRRWRFALRSALMLSRGSVNR